METDIKKWALITGGSSGIGLELSKCFARDGYNLILVARKEEELKKAQKELEENTDISILIRATDLTDSQNVQSLYDFVTEKNIEISALVNNAGFGSSGSFAELSLEKQLSMIRLNVETLTHLTRLFVSGMVDRKKGNVLNVSSIAAYQPGPGMAVYYATKAYVSSFSEALSYELRNTGVSVTTLAPGATSTGFQEVADLTDSHLSDTSFMSPRVVAEAGYNGMLKGERVVIPGFRNRINTLLARFLPKNFILKTVSYLHSDDEQKKR